MSSEELDAVMKRMYQMKRSLYIDRNKAGESEL